MLLRRVLSPEHGVTVVELMITTLVMGVLMGIAVPTIQLQIARQELHGATRQVEQTLSAARNSALNDGIPRYVLFTPGTPGSLRLHRFDGSAWIADGNTVILSGSVGFTAQDITLPAVAGAPETGASVPADAAYFDTRGAYPLGYPGPYTILLRGGSGRTATLTLYPQTGAVTGG